MSSFFVEQARSYPLNARTRLFENVDLRDRDFEERTKHLAVWHGRPDHHFIYAIFSRTMTDDSGRRFYRDGGGSWRRLKSSADFLELNRILDRYRSAEDLKESGPSDRRLQGVLVQNKKEVIG